MWEDGRHPSVGLRLAVGGRMTDRATILAKREGAVEALMWFWGFAPGKSYDERHRLAEAETVRLFPLPRRTVPTVRQGVAEGGKWWYQCEGSLPPSVFGRYCVWRYRNRADALAGQFKLRADWPPEDQPTVAALLLLPLTEDVEDAGEEGDK